MPTIPPIELKALYDGTEVAAGTSATIANLQELETATGTAATSINTDLASVGTTATTELATTVPAAVDAGAVGLTTRSTKFKAVGSELGQSLTDGVASGVSAPQAAANIGTSMSGLLAASASTGVGIAAAVGVGLAVAIVKGITDGAAKRKQEVIDAYNSLFSAIEVEAADSARKIKASILDAFDFQTVITELGHGDINAGITQINDLVDLTGQKFNDIVLLLQNGVTPATKDTAAAVKEIVDAGVENVGVQGQIDAVLGAQAKKASDLLALADANSDKQSQLLEQKKAEAGFAFATALSAKEQGKAVGELVGKTAAAADQAERMAAATERAEQAAYRLGQNLGEAAGAAARIAFE